MNGKAGLRAMICLIHCFSASISGWVQIWDHENTLEHNVCTHHMQVASGREGVRGRGCLSPAIPFLQRTFLHFTYKYGNIMDPPTMDLQLFDICTILKYFELIKNLVSSNVHALERRHNWNFILNLHVPFLNLWSEAKFKYISNKIA